MFIPLLLTLILASVALTVSSVVTEEVECLTAKLIAFLLFLSSLYLTPLVLKLILLVFLMGIQRYLSGSSESNEI